MTRTGRPRSSAADDSILRAARQLLVERGIAAASMEEIARTAGVSKVTVYRRWSSREDLLAAAVESASGDMPGRASPGAEARDLDPAMSFAQMSSLIEAALPAAAHTMASFEYRALLAQAFGSRFTHPGIMVAFWDNHIVPRRNVAIPMLHKAVAEKHLPANTDVESLIDMTVGSLLYRLLQPGEISPEELLEYLRRIYRQAGLLAVRSEG
ncbi:TetR/AcrR family transcriptional regulator [Microbacterium sp. MPKO10]|uniref:TetR/AcrR family transcriptional regulator n=1 Tax=Microbacterium sp. MPKO10 TaxID=2989818 RepID=UPI002235AED0|nr:TetR/AcrR family transcriptional regulator [Microbacterium sp. MPKO10]MCW4459941.1 TetR/AcrR family transcriptional regulator [Microbacterium sp. MPKO10]